MIWLIGVVYTGLLTSQRVAYESVSVIIVQSTCISYLSSLAPCRTARFAVILYAKIVQCLRLNGCFVYSRKQGNTVSLLFVSAALFTAVNLFGSQRRRSLSLLIPTLIFPALLPCLVRDSLCTALQTKILWINRSLNAIDTIETWVSGNLTVLTERSQPAIRWRVGEVANRVSSGSFRGGHWYLPIRNHDNRYFADWSRLYPGLSKNSENGNSCPKPHKAARMIEAVGRAVSIETEL